MIYIHWWTPSGNEVSLPMPVMAHIPHIGCTLDLEGLSDEEVEQHLPEDERQNLERFKVVGVVFGINRVDIEVERDPEYVHQQELEAKDASIAHVQCTAGHVLDLLQLVVADGVFFALDGGGDKRDLVAAHVAEGTVLGTALFNAVDAVYVYPSVVAAKKRDTSRRCIKHKYPELVTK